MSAALAFERFSYRYPGAATPALQAVDLAVAPGELVVLAGASGSGKSTLLRAGCGLAPHFHGGEAAGRVRAAGLDLRTHGPKDLGGRVGVLLQDPETQIVMGSVRAELAFGLENRGLPAGAVAREVEEVALALGIGALLDRPTHELSGGELQRVALGAAVAGRPPLLLLDEPSSQLDPVAGDELVWLIRRLNEQWGAAVVLAEHRLERVLAAADRVVALARGQIACSAPPQEFLAWAASAAPELLPPAASMCAAAGLRPLPAGVKAARAALRAAGFEPAVPDAPAAAPAPAAPARRADRRRGPAPALRLRRIWHELPGGRTVLRDVSLDVAAGERVALMGRNGAGKSTLLRHAAGLTAPTRGTVQAPGRVALLLQTPGDYLVHERAGDEASAEALAAAGLAGLADRHPRDLSGGERQRLALAVVTDPAAGAPGAVLLDEPTRGMDAARRDDLVARLAALAAAGAAVVVATHDPELAAATADRVVLLGEGAVLADAPAAEVLADGWYFATETARVLGGRGGALLPADGAAVLRAGLGLAGPNGLPAPGGDAGRRAGAPAAAPALGSAAPVPGAAP